MRGSEHNYSLTLYITGATTRSVRAIDNVSRFCSDELGDDVDLEVVDLYENPGDAVTDQVVATPVLIRHHPKPVRRLIGDMADAPRLNHLLKST